MNKADKASNRTMRRLSVNKSVSVNISDNLIARQISAQTTFEVPSYNNRITLMALNLDVGFCDRSQDEKNINGRHFVFHNQHTCSRVLDVDTKPLTESDLKDNKNRLSEFDPLLRWGARVMHW